MQEARGMQLVIGNLFCNCAMGFKKNSSDSYFFT